MAVAWQPGANLQIRLDAADLFRPQVRDLGHTENDMRKTTLAAAIMACASIPASAAEPNGDWFTAEKTAVVRVAPCGAQLCGNIAWTAKPGFDSHNPDPAKRTRSVLGMQIFSMKPAGPNRWEGDIYNGQDGKTYSGHIALQSANVLKIEGCVMGFLCGGESWARAKCEETHPPAGVAGAASKPTLTACRAVAP
jgi:uncharacterized protein (DUF2147 family)